MSGGPEQGRAKADLPPAVARVLDDFVAAAPAALEGDLRAVVLFGSAAEGRLRATSDVNLIVVLARFDRERVDRLREAYQAGRAAVRLECMFLLESEIAAAAESFAGKMADVRRRRRVLYGADPFADLAIPRDAALRQLRQLLLNLVLRLRAAYVERSLHEEQLAIVVAEAAGPLRSCAASLLELEGSPASSPREALERLVAVIGEPEWEHLSAELTEARQRRRLPPGDGARVLFQLIALADRMLDRAGRLG